MAGNDQVDTFNSDPPANAPDAAALEKGKGKGKAADYFREPESAERGDNESSEDESAPEDLTAEDADEEDHDNLEPISTDNIIGGRRTRGKKIDFVEAAEKARAAGDDNMDEDEDDEDFVAEEGDGNHGFPSSLHQRGDPRGSSSLFDSYNSGERSRPSSRSPASRHVSGYGTYHRAGTAAVASPQQAVDGYPSHHLNDSIGGGVGSRNTSVASCNGSGSGAGVGYRAATPNSKGHYSDAVLSSLESQNDSEIEGISAKVKMLKDITVAIGEEIRDSSTIVDLNNSFDNTGLKLRRAMNRMLLMSERAGVGWRLWALFLAAVFFIFVYVWIS